MPKYLTEWGYRVLLGQNIAFWSKIRRSLHLVTYALDNHHLGHIIGQWLHKWPSHRRNKPTDLLISSRQAMNIYTEKANQYSPSTLLN